MFQTKEQDQYPEINLNEMKIENLPKREFKIMVIQMLTMVRRAVHEQSDNFNKDVKNIRKYQNRNH